MSFKYSKQPEVGKAYVGMLRNAYRVWIYDDVTPEGATSAHHTNDVFGSLDKALAKAYELNDWQWLKGQVYRFLPGLNMEPWEHAFVKDGKAYIFVWDTRELLRVVKYDGELKSPAVDNGKPISRRGKWLFMSELTAIPATECDMPMSDAGNINLAPDAIDVNEGVKAIYEVRGFDGTVFATNCTLHNAELVRLQCGRKAKIVRIG